MRPGRYNKAGRIDHALGLNAEQIPADLLYRFSFDQDIGDFVPAALRVYESAVL